ncbi:uncharacterized protein LOC121837822 [Ixodes scapularis]|uniref:uncharacterized protein LOC121837822 n=1 Tax=Ixodes scapularis TaxID=6945 RepID=UPI001A9FD0ED|nr:uncharacterized protein LOC121837822 [Ixodes scapularis]
MVYAKLFLVVCAGLYCLTPCSASVQTPTLSSCSSTHVVAISAVTIANSRVGRTMAVSYTGRLTTTLNDSPALNFTMTEKTGGGLIPCVVNVGSCQHQLCAGTNAIEVQIGQPWNNTCPIAPLNYTSGISIPISFLAGAFIGNGNLRLKIAAIENGSVVECREFDYKIALY